MSKTYYGKDCEGYSYGGREKNENISQKAGLLGKWLWFLFWLIIPSALASAMTNENIVQLFPALYWPGQILNTLCSVAYAVILLKISSENKHYLTSGICCLISVISSTILAFISTQAWTLIISLPAAVISLIGEYHEYVAHSEIIYEIDEEQSKKWTSLWKWFIITFCAMFASIIVILLSPFLGLAVLLISLIGVLVVSILKLVYLYRTAKLFREYL